jgi:hypothetical protein
MCVSIASVLLLTHDDIMRIQDVWGKCCRIAKILHGRRAKQQRQVHAFANDQLAEDWTNGSAGVVVLLVGEGPMLPMMMLGKFFPSVSGMVSCRLDA